MGGLRNERQHHQTRQSLGRDRRREGRQWRAQASLYSGFATKAAAAAKCAELVHATNTGSYTAPTQLTLDGLLEKRMDVWETKRQISPETAVRYRELIAGQIQPYLGAVPIQKLKPDALEAWHGTLLAAGLAPRTIQAAHRLVGKALKQAMRDGLVVQNVAKLVSPPKRDDDEEAEEVMIVKEDQLAVLLDRIKGRAIAPKVIVALFCGIRRGELLALRWRNVDLDAGVLRVRENLQAKVGYRFKAPKTKAGRRDVSMPDIAVEALRAHRIGQMELRMKLGMGKLGDDDLVFANHEGKPQSPIALSGEWLKLARSIGLAGVNFHALRHTCASMLIAAGMDVVAVSKHLGHANPSVTLAVYSHLFKSDDKAAAAAINAALNKLGR
jgi:integrase